MENNMLTSAKDGCVEYHKNLALEYKRKLDETQQELEEFQESSRDLEAELETQLEQLESQNKELRSGNCHLQTECEKLQNKLECSQMEFYQVISSLQDELNKTKLLKEDLHRYVRMLEQKNDDLERATRASLTTLEDFEGRLNQAIERNVFLENELDDKENMTVVVQRLKDETRDLKQELLVHDSLNLQGCQPPRKFQDAVVDSNKLVTCEEILPNIPPQRSFTHPNFVSKSSPVMPNSALNIVSDLLRKVGVLESKLQSCRNCIKDNSSPLLGKNLTSPLASPKKVLHINGSPVSNNKERVPFSA